MPNYRPRGKHRRKAPALDERQQVSSYTFSALDLQSAAGSVVVETRGSMILTTDWPGRYALALLGAVVHR